MKLKVEGEMVGFYLASILVGMLLLVGVSAAAPVTYSVNRTVAAGSVIGTIQTDGTTGVLIAANITDWNLTLYDGINTFVLTGPLSGNNSHVFIVGSDVSATPTNLSFNFSGLDSGYFLFQVSFGSGQHYYCDSTYNGPCLAGETVVPQTLSTIQHVAASGISNIGTSGGVSFASIPTLSDWSIIALATLLFGTALWIQHKRGALAMRDQSRGGHRFARGRKTD